MTPWRLQWHLLDRWWAIRSRLRSRTSAHPPHYPKQKADAEDASDDDVDVLV
jgi:hypothetical protein